MRALESRVVEALQDAADRGVALAVVAGVSGEFNLVTAREKLLQLRNRCEPGFVHVDDHRGDDQPTQRLPPFHRLQAHFSLEIHASLRLIPRWTRLRLSVYRRKRHNHVVSASVSPPKP